MQWSTRLHKIVGQSQPFLDWFKIDLFKKSIYFHLELKKILNLVVLISLNLHKQLSVLNILIIFIDLKVIFIFILIIPAF